MLRMSYCDHFCPSSICPSIHLSAHLQTHSNDNSSKAIEAIYPQLGKNIAWVGDFKIAKIMGICLLV